MGLIDTADWIARLIYHPVTKRAASQFLNSSNQFAGPLRPPSSTSNNSPGASPIFGGISDLSSIIGRAASVPGLANNQQQPVDPMTELYTQLVNQLRQPVDSPTGIDTADLMAQVRKAIDPIYDQREKAAQSLSAHGRQEVQNMYGALSKEYQELAPQQVAQAADAQKKVEDLYGQLRSNIEGSYARVSQEQGDLFKSLGIESALPDVLSKQAAPVQEASIAADENQAQQQQRYLDQGQIDSTYYRQGAPLATMTGNEISTDMLSQLQNYMNQTEAERTSGIQNAYFDQLNQAQGQLAQQQQSAQSEAARRQEMLWSMLQGQVNGKQQSLTPDTFMGQLPQEVQQAVAGAFTQLERSPEAVYGKVEDKRNPVPGSFVETTPEWYMAQADQMLQNGEIDPTTHQALLMYMQLYFGLGK